MQVYVKIPWVYGDKAIRLWVYEVFAFDGEPPGLEVKRCNGFLQTCEDMNFQGKRCNSSCDRPAKNSYL